MSEEETKILQERLKKIKLLPPKIADVLFSEKTADQVEELVKKYNLKEKYGDVSEAIAKILTGESDPRNLTKDLQQKDIETETALHLSEDINNKIFAPVRIHLQKLHPPSAFKPHVEDHEPLVSAQPAEMEGAIIPGPTFDSSSGQGEIPARYGTGPEKPIFSPPTEPAEENIVDLRQKQPPGEDKYLESIKDESAELENEEPAQPKPLQEGNVVDLSENR